MSEAKSSYGIFRSTIVWFRTRNAEEIRDKNSKIGMVEQYPDGGEGAKSHNTESGKRMGIGS